MFKKLIAGALLASLALATIAPVGASAIESRGKLASNVDGVTRLVNYSANNDNSLSTLITAATCPAFNGAVVQLLATTPKATLFAPTNAAFRNLGQALGLGPAGINSSNVCKVDQVLGIPNALFTILGYHVLAPGKVWYKQAKALRPAKVQMFTGENAVLKGQGDIVTIDGARVAVANIRSKNLQIHVVNGVMVPPSISAALAS